MLWDGDTGPLPPEEFRTAKILRVAHTLVSHYSDSPETRVHIALSLEETGKVMTCAADADDHKDLLLVQPGDRVLVGATKFDGSELWLRSLRIIYPGHDKPVALAEVLSMPARCRATVIRAASGMHTHLSRPKTVHCFALEVESANRRFTFSIVDFASGSAPDQVVPLLRAGDQVDVVLDVSSLSALNVFVRELSIVWSAPAKALHKSA